MKKNEAKQVDKQARKIFGTNLAALLVREMAGKTEKARAKALGVGIRSLRRILAGEQGVSIDTMARMARKLNTPLWHLSFPDLDPSNPPVFPVTDTEKALYAALTQKARELATRPH